MGISWAEIGSGPTWKRAPPFQGAIGGRPRILQGEQHRSAHPTVCSGQPSSATGIFPKPAAIPTFDGVQLAILLESRPGRRPISPRLFFPGHLGQGRSQGSIARVARTATKLLGNAVCNRLRDRPQDGWLLRDTLPVKDAQVPAAGICQCVTRSRYARPMSRRYLAEAIPSQPNTAHPTARDYVARRNHAEDRPHADRNSNPDTRTD